MDSILLSWGFFQTHMNSCDFLVNLVSNDSANKQSDVDQLKAKLESLTIDVSTLKEMVI